MKKVSLALLFFSLMSANAQNASNLFTDYNGDGNVSLACFGDSITYGIGDGVPVGRSVEEFPPVDGSTGYPARIETLASVLVDNEGIPGEQLLTMGSARLSELFRTTNADSVIIMEGANDAILQVTGSDYEIALQRSLNVAALAGKQAILATLIEPCCEHAGLVPFTQSYSRIVRELGAIYEVPVVDVERDWQNSCIDKEACELYNVPEGLHPNKKGYDLISQSVLGKLYGLELSQTGAAAQLEQILGLSAGSVIVKPQPTPATSIQNTKTDF